MATTMKDLGVRNKMWGICGFTSTFYAMWELNPGSRGALMNAPRSFTVLAEIKQYLKILQASGEKSKLDDITNFTRHFGGRFHDFTIENYIKRINESVHKDEDDIKNDPLFGIAMPPHCTADYIKRIWNRDVRILREDPGGNAILGVQNTANKNMTMYDGLSHYLYRHENRIYSWGNDPYASVTAANNAYVVQWTLQFI